MICLCDYIFDLSYIGTTKLGRILSLTVYNLIPLIEQDIQIATTKSINPAVIGIGITNDQCNEEVIFFCFGNNKN